MRPSAFTDGNQQGRPLHQDREGRQSASMRPSAFTDGNMPMGNTFRLARLELQ